MLEQWKKQEYKAQFWREGAASPGNRHFFYHERMLERCTRVTKWAKTGTF